MMMMTMQQGVHGVLWAFFEHRKSLALL